MKTFFTKLKVYLKPFFCIFMAFALVGPASALSDAELDYMNTIGAYYYNPSGVDCAPGVSGVNISGNDATEKTWTALVSLGFTDIQAAAIMGNIQAESGFNPFAVNGASNYSTMTWEQLLNDINPATGIIQMKNGRRQTMLNNLPNNVREYFLNPSRFGTTGTTYSSIVSEIGESNYDSVLASELKTFYDGLDDSRFYKLFLDDSTVEDAALTFCTYNEAPGQTTAEARANCQASSRSSYARNWYDQYAGTTSAGTPATANDGSNVLIIGDSITVRSESALKSLMPNVSINAEVGRHFNTGLDILKNTPQSGLRNILVFALGTNANGTNETNARAVIDYVGSSRQVIFVTNYSLGAHDYTQNNALFKSLANEYNNVIVADWSAAVSGNPNEYIANEGGSMDVHPTIPAGTELFAKTIYNTITNGAANNSNANSCYGGDSAWNSTDLPNYDQCDPRWGKLWFGPGGINGGQGLTICWGGCGPSSFAIMATTLLGREILPSETSDKAGLAGMNYYSPGSGYQGSAFGITSYLAGQYGLQYKVFPGGGGRENCIAAVNSALQDGWMLHVAGGNLYGTGNPPFTPVGHLIGITGLTADGKWVIADSAHGNNTYEPAEVLNAGLNCGTLRGIKR